MTAPYAINAFRERLVMGYLSSSVVAAITSALDAHGPDDPAGQAAWATTVASLVEAADPHHRDDAGRRLAQAIADGQIPHAIDLLARRIPIATVAYLGQVDRLSDVTAALDAGYPVDVATSLHSTSALTCGDLVSLHASGMPGDLLTSVIDSHTAGETFRVIVTSGGTWDDIAVILRSGVPDTDGPLQQYAIALTTPTIDRIPSRVTRLAALLSAPGTGTSALDLLPLAAALTGQPWEATAVGLLRDTRFPIDPGSHTVILTARALEKDPTLPAPDPAPRPWAPPPILAGYRPLPQDTPPRETLLDARVPPDVTSEVLDWLHDHDTVLRTWGVPENGSWGLPAWGAIAAALAAGATVTDLRLTSTVIHRGRTLGSADAALALACGATLANAEEWARAGGDVVATALLTAWGIDEPAALDLSRTDSAWHAIELLAGGIPADDVPALLPVFAGRSPSVMWPRSMTAYDGLPISPRVLVAIADSGLPLAEVPLVAPPAGPHETPTPDEVNLLSVAATRNLAPDTPLGDGWPYEHVVLAYAAAAAGQPWARHITPPDGSTDRRIDVAAQVLAARGITPPVRAVTRPASGHTATAPARTR